MVMDINQMYYFKKIVESDFNLTDASKKIHISQSALSQFIIQLEELHSIKLFNRKHNRLIGLSPIGASIYESVNQILKLYEEMEDKIERAHNDNKAHIAFGATASYPQTLLPVFFTEFAMSHSNIEIDLIENGAVNILQRFNDGEFDFALIAEPIDYKKDFAESRTVYRDQLAAFMTANHPLAEQDHVSWQEIAKYPIITLNSEYATYHKVHSAFKKRNLTPDIVFHSSSWQYLIDAIQQDSDTITIMPLKTPIFAQRSHIIAKHFEMEEPFTVILAKKLQKKETKEVQLVEKMLLRYLPTVE